MLEMVNVPPVPVGEEIIAGRRANDYGSGYAADTARRIARDIMEEYKDLLERRKNYRTFVERMARAEADACIVEAQITTLDRKQKLTKEETARLKLCQERLETLRKESDKCLDEIGETPREQRMREVEDACLSNLYVRYKKAIDAMRNRGMKPGDFTSEAKELAVAKSIDLRRYTEGTLEPLPEEARQNVIDAIEQAFPESKAEKESE